MSSPSAPLPRTLPVTVRGRRDDETCQFTPPHRQTGQAARPGLSGTPMMDVPVSPRRLTNGLVS
ncbi:hypothetical protein LAJ19_19400 (plasmid) [Deinococcus taeanensis]|uniref:hypothetical protein n=1 Tax=Deinococcus taeanensis TaxID=2737050 RepID=UPI001CDD68EF|nr:hypothetical protein [Deinococcus taeanensis]UBV44956.1 hypothetical protein LAJ19_19400 [Deinococcus taeanensis]